MSVILSSDCNSHVFNLPIQSWMLPVVAFCIDKIKLTSKSYSPDSVATAFPDANHSVI